MSEYHIMLAKELEKIDRSMLQVEKDFNPLIKKVHRSQKKNALNLLHYLVLRSLDIRDLQNALHAVGLSSMASSESHVRGQILVIEQHLGVKKSIPKNVFNYETSKVSLAKKATALFGKKQMDSIPYIMVTFDTSLADDYAKVKNLLLSGMNIARINCAHDNENTWFRMIQHIQRASKITGQPCKIYMDLAGPKIRTVIHKKKKLKIEIGSIVYLTDEANMNKDLSVVGCTIPNIAEQLKAGETVLFDDGLIEACVEKIESNKARLQIVRISAKKPFIKHEKGINFPDSTLITPTLTEFDKQCLPFIKKYADLVGYSFVRNSNDIIQLQNELGKRKQYSLILKIETPEAVSNLPDLLFTGMHQENLGVMIARGDLAIEIGFERMSEIQEEILWICEAGHIPVIWATQVLETLNKSGLATRSEVTDAAHAAQADCVMINKGTHIIETMETLKDILLRSGGHHVKKRFIFRPLAIAKRFMTKHRDSSHGNKTL